VARLGPFLTQGPPTPVDLVNFGRVRDLPMLLGAALSGLALATVAHLLITAVRRRGRDFAILRTLGCTRGQLRRAAAWQAGTLTGVALAIGIPAGAICGRAAWQIFAHRLGILPVLVLPLWQFALITGAALVLALAVAAWPGEFAARASTAQVLRRE
jgi:ABC-type lipoprotein release transport system permease subunit